MNKDEMKMIEEMEQVLQDEQIRIANSADGFKQLMKNGVCNCHATALYNAGYRKVGEDEIVVKKSEHEELKTHIEDLQTKLGAVMLCIKNTHEIDISDILRKQEQETAREILQMIYDKGKDTGIICLPAFAIKQLAKAYRIELE